MQKFNIKAQIRKLYCIDSFGALMIAGASWVALLAARGFSTFEIGWFESIFHVVSMVCEVPSGAVADVFGRKKSMVMAQIMSMLAAMLMIFTDSFLSIAIAMGVSALSYNLASGTREALAYDSMALAGTEKDYERFVSTDMIIYEIFSSLATLLAGVALLLGYRRAYLVDIIMGSVALLFALSLSEVHAQGHESMDVASRFKDVTVGSVKFIKENRKARLIILFNASIGAVAVLIGFFLQAKLPEVGLKAIYLGPALFIIGMSGAVGSKSITYFDKLGYKTIGLISFVGALLATLMSINSFTFSVVMIVLSPIFGWIFQ